MSVQTPIVEVGSFMPCCSGCGDKVELSADGKCIVCGDDCQGVGGLPEQTDITPFLKPWAAEYDACIQCGTSSTPHEGHGLCKTCYGKRWRESRSESAGQVIATERTVRTEVERTIQRQPIVHVNVDVTTPNTRAVSLKDGAGWLALRVEVDLIQLSTEDRAFVCGMIDRIKQYANDGKLECVCCGEMFPAPLMDDSERNLHWCPTCYEREIALPDRAAQAAQ